MLPRHSTPFIGRAEEVAEIAHLLNNPACQLLTLAGPGGIGKTRLALEVAQGFAAVETKEINDARNTRAGLRPAPTHFTHGVHFVPLQALASPDFLMSTIAETLNFQFHSGDSKQQLLHYFHDKVLLLVLDNFEHLMDGAELLSEILNNAPGVRILATSRERLNLLEEWVFDVRELRFPTNEGETEIDSYDAVQLFMQHARRVHSGFTLSASQKPAVIRICRLVGGMPLAIELAAAWVRVLPCESIADEIERSLDILESSARNIEDRHRTIWAAFEPTWRRLPVDEADVFKKLAVFRGGFTREAAEQITGTSLRTLSALVDKSLIRREADGRYQMHELLRQYADEQLSKSDEAATKTHDAHTNYYMRLLGRREMDLYSARQRETIQELEAELDNIRAAWQQAVDEANVMAFQTGGFAYYDFADLRGRYQEGIDAIEKAIKRLKSIAADPERDFALAILHNAISGLYIRVGRFEEARKAVETSIAAYRELGRRPHPGFATEPLSGMGLLSLTTGDYDAAVMYCEEAIQAVDADDKLNIMFAKYVLASATYSQGNSQAAFDHAQQAYQISQEFGDDYFGSYILIVMGNVAQALEDYDKAWEYYETSYKIKKDFKEYGGMAFALNYLGRIALLREDYAEAKRLFQQGYDLYRDVNDPGGIATSNFGLGDNALAEAEYSAAQTYFYDALVMATDIHWTPLILAILAGVGDLLLRSGDTEQAAELLALAAQHPASEPPTCRRANQLLKQHALGKTQRKVSDLDATVRRVCEMLKAPKHYPIDTQPLSPKTVDALSEREIEILRLLAQGMTNQEIAEALFLVLGTIKAHNNHIFSKLGVKNRTQAIKRAQELGLI